MNKMTSPEMEVIRFKEKDIVAASGNKPSFAHLFGWGNGIDGDAGITFEKSNTTYSWKTLHSEALHGMISDLRFMNNGHEATLNQLALDENKPSTWNGKYQYEEETNTWQWISKE